MPVITDRPMGSPSSLLAIAVAANRAGDRDLARAAIRELRDEHGIRVSFVRSDPKGRDHERR